MDVCAISTIITILNFNGVFQELFRRRTAGNLIQMGLNRVQWPTHTKPEGRQQVPRVYVGNHVALAFLPINLLLNITPWHGLRCIIITSKWLKNHYAMVEIKCINTTTFSENLDAAMLVFQHVHGQLTFEATLLTTIHLPAFDSNYIKISGILTFFSNTKGAVYCYKTKQPHSLFGYLQWTQRQYSALWSQRKTNVILP